MKPVFFITYTDKPNSVPNFKGIHVGILERVKVHHYSKDKTISCINFLKLTRSFALSIVQCYSLH